MTRQVTQRSRAVSTQIYRIMLKILEFQDPNYSNQQSQINNQQSQINI
uniref:Uncharacterized protein n=1 Tax=Arundo donax TaxID=35708 RepID=A0A0A9D6W4_ARUDO